MVLNINLVTGCIVFLTLFTHTLSSADELSINGPDAPVNGDSYTVSGGCAPYTWTISKGSISTDGSVTVSGNCGKARIGVTDSCGNTTFKIVKMQQGQWSSTSNYELAHGQNPDGWTAGEWHDFGLYRVKLASVTAGAGTIWVDGLQRCPDAKLGWVGPIYYAKIGNISSTYSSCTGAPSGAWWNGVMYSTYFSEQVCPGSTPCEVPYNHYASGYPGPAGYLPNDGLFTYIGGYFHAWMKHSRQQNVSAFVIQVEEWKCGSSGTGGSGGGDPTCDDNDNDGYYAISANCGNDPDDFDPSVYPGAPENCGDGMDNNGDGRVDEGCFGDSNLTTCM